MTDELIEVPLTINQIVFINERLRLDRKRRKHTENDLIKEIEVPTVPNTIVKLSTPQIIFINSRLAKNRRARESSRIAKQSKTPRGPTVKDPIIEIKLQTSGIAIIVSVSSQNSPDNSPPYMRPLDTFHSLDPRGTPSSI